MKMSKATAIRTVFHEDGYDMTNKEIAGEVKRIYDIEVGPNNIIGVIGSEKDRLGRNAYPIGSPSNGPLVPNYRAMDAIAAGSAQSGASSGVASNCITSRASAEWNLSDGAIRVYLEGKMLLVPKSLYEAVQAEKWGLEKEETALLIWATLYSAKKKDGPRYVNMHNTRMCFGSETTAGEARKWLLEKGFLQEPTPNLWIKQGCSKHHPKGRSKRYRAVHSGETQLVELKEKSWLSGHEGDFELTNPASRYTRLCLDQLQYDEAQLIDGVRSVICAYRSKVLERSINNKNKGKGRKNRREIKDAEGALYQLGKPLFELMHRRGGIVRGDKGGRLFSPFAFLMRGFRPLFTFGGPMEISDMVECQPSILGNIAGDEGLVQDCLSRQFYQGIAEELGLVDEAGQIDRNAAKEPYCVYGYGRNHPDSPLAQYMSKKYPRAAQYMYNAKVGGHEKFSHELQQIESSIFVEGVYKRLEKEEIPALTLHDGIASRACDGDRIEEIIYQELASATVAGKRKEIRGRIDREIYF